MAAADWTTIPDGGTAIAGTDVTATYSPPDILAVTGVQFENIPVGALLNARIDATIQRGTSGAHILALRTQGTLINDDRYYAYIGLFAGQFDLGIYRVVAAVSTLLVNVQVSPSVGTVTDWQRWRFTVVTSGSDVLSRIELWNGSSFISQTSFLDAGGTKITTSGGQRFGAINAGAPSSNFDEVIIESAP